MVEPVKKNGVGYMDPELVAVTANTVQTYMGGKDLPPIDKMYTNKFIGSVKLTDQEWAAVQARSEKYLPKKAS
jgi:hypothetical protein